MKRKRKVPLTTVTTPRALKTIQLLGPGMRHESVLLSRDEYRAINKLYGLKEEGPNQKPEPPEEPKREDFPDIWTYEKAIKAHEEVLKAMAAWQDPRPLMQAGADRNAMRHVEHDGLRLLSWFAKYVPAGEDPLKHLVQAVVSAGWDVDPEDIEWAEGELAGVEDPE